MNLSFFINEMLETNVEFIHDDNSIIVTLLSDDGLNLKAALFICYF